MSVTGLQLSYRVSHSAIPYLKAYSQYVIEDVVPIFTNLSGRAFEIADQEFERLGKQLEGEGCDGNMSVAAKAAEQNGRNIFRDYDNHSSNESKPVCSWIVSSA